MQDVKRIEIIAGAFERGVLKAALEKSGAHSHAVIGSVAGKQLHAGQEDLDMTMQENVYILAFCDPTMLDGILAAIRPLLKRFGGTCHITDALDVTP